MTIKPNPTATQRMMAHVERTGLLCRVTMAAEEHREAGDRLHVMDEFTHILAEIDRLLGRAQALIGPRRR
jgi:hypothetical protein